MTTLDNLPIKEINGFAGDTYVYTADFGMVQMSAISGNTVTVLNGNYEKSKVIFKSYGVQNVWELVLSRGGHLEKTYRVTPDHEWILENMTKVKTEDLRQQKLKSIHGDIWTVKEVIPTEELTEVFCCEEITTHSFILQSGLLTSSTK